MRLAPPCVLPLALAALALAAGCARAPELEELPPPPLTVEAAPAVTIESAAVVGGRVVVTFALADGDAPITGANAAALAPAWTLAWLDVEPVSGLPAWRSLLLTGSQTAVSLPPAGPGTPAAQRLTNVKAPGTETAGTTVELGDGRFTYTYANALPGAHPLGATLRVGVYLGAAAGTPLTNATHDFVPNGGPLQSYDLVRDESCNACHGVLSAHGGRRIGVKMCITCHTWLCTDPDTIDPAAIAPATKADYPNPMEMARLVHRIHRGKKLPTLFKASDWAAANRTWPPENPLYASSPWPASPFTAAPPLPYLNGRNAPAPVGTKFNVIGYRSTEFVFGRIASRVENFQPAKTLAEGVGYPQDLRNCEACHANGPQASAIGTGTSTDVSISRRTCSGCHPDVFYGDPDDASVVAPDATHLAHTGGKQVDDAACKDCHVVARTGGPKLYAPISEAHRPLNSRAPRPSPRWSRVTAEIVSVQNLRPGELPIVRFKLSDRNGSITPLDAPTLPMDLVAPASPVPRRMTGLSLLLSGPTSDYLTGNAGITTSLLSRNGYTGAYTIAAGFSTAEDPATHAFTYTFTKALPATATGTWAVSIEGRRRPDNAAVLPAYDLATDTFNWPYTGETVSEHFTNDLRYVDLSTGALTTEPSRARRTVVSQAKCEACHLELNLHGANRHDVAHCVTCHTPDATDWDKRPRDTRTLADGGVVGNGMVLLSDPVDPLATLKSWGFATLDGLEERSIHMKTMTHRIHVGEREGAASLEGMRPFVIYGYRTSATAAPSAYFFDDIRFPGDLADCELCHLPGTWTIEAIPADAQRTTANENGNLLHTGTSTTPATASHAASDPKVLPVTATCLSCHTSGAAVDHAAGNTSGGVEACGTCHGESGAESVRKRHSVR